MLEFNNKIKSIWRLLSQNLAKPLWSGFVIMYLLQLYIIAANSVDIPFQDEWKYFEPWHPMCFPETLSLKWLLTRNNEHHLFFTHLMSWINLKLFGMNFTIQKIINYLIFGFLLALINRLKNQLVGHDKFIYFPVFLIFTLSPIVAENHTWAFQTPFHFVLIFFILLVTQLSFNDLSVKRSATILLISNMAMYSLASGVVFSAVCILFRSIYLSEAEETISAKLSYRLHILLLLTVIGLSVILWFLGYHKPDAALNRTWPSELAFWDYFLNLLSFGFGFSSMNIVPGIFLSVFTLLPVVLMLVDKKTRTRPEVISISAAITGLITVLLIISFGRAGLGEPKTSRYAEFAIFIIPFVSIAWWLLLEKSKWRAHVLGVFWLVCSGSFYNSWDEWSEDKYHYAHQADSETLECVERYYSGNGDGKCQGFWMEPEDLDFARKLNVHFTRHSEPAIITK